MRLGSNMTRTSRRGAFFGSRLATMMTSLIPRRWDMRRPYRFERCTIKPVTIARSKPFARDAGRELYHQFCNIVGGVISPLLANIFLNRLDKFVEWEFKANRTQSGKERGARRSKDYRKIENKLTKTRKKLADAEPEERRTLVDEIKKLKKQQSHTTHYDKDKKHPCKVRYVRYADDCAPRRRGKEATMAT